MNISEVLCELSNAVSVGDICLADIKAKEILGKFCSVETLQDGTVYGKLDRGAEHTVLIEAHIDEVCFVVTNVSDDGFIFVAKAGGIDERVLPAQRVTVMGDKRYSGTFCSTPPHLLKGKAKPQKIDELCIDIGLSKNVKEHIQLGSFVFFEGDAKALSGTKYCGKALDNRAGVTAVLIAAEILSKCDFLNCNVSFAFTKSEELGCRGAITAAANIEADSAIVVDTTFGDLPGVSPVETGTLGRGPLIGKTPVLSKDITDLLSTAATDSGIKTQFEIMASRTGTNADVISVSGDGVPTALISIPIRNMHTPNEIVDIKDIKACGEIIANAVTEWR